MRHGSWRMDAALVAFTDPLFTIESQDGRRRSLTQIDRPLKRLTFAGHAEPIRHDPLPSRASTSNVAPASAISRTVATAAVRFVRAASATALQVYGLPGRRFIAHQLCTAFMAGASKPDR